MVPGIALSIVSGLLILVFIADTFLFAGGGVAMPATPAGTAQLNPAVLYGAMAFCALANAAILFSMIQMLRLRMWGLAFAGCIVAALPIPSSACCLLTLPFAIWAIVILLDAKVKAAFT
jgi:hypothetical protein